MFFLSPPKHTLTVAGIYKQDHLGSLSSHTHMHKHSHTTFSASMEPVMRISLLRYFAAIAMFFPLATHSQMGQLPPLRPLCVSQYNLANYACTRLPYTPGPPPSPSSPSSPPPSPPSPPSPDDDRSHHSHRRHRHRHHHGHRHREHQETPVEAECCKWLEHMDAECVCDLLVHLPPFLARPAHSYTVIVDESCSVTFACGGRVIR